MKTDFLFSCFLFLLFHHSLVSSQGESASKNVLSYTDNLDDGLKEMTHTSDARDKL